jgi:multidrug resistance efflux pump
MSRRSLVIVLQVAAVAGLGLLGLQRLRAAPGRNGVPTARVARGSVSLDVEAEGELRAPRSMMVVAPAVGGSLQIVRLAGTGVIVKAGDPVVEFDPAEQEYNLEQARFDLDQADQEVAKTRADGAVQAAQDEVALLQAQFAVKRAELDVRGNELLGEVEAQKNLLALEEARRGLDQLQEDVKSHVASSDASLAVLNERRHKAQLAMQTAERNIDSMAVRSPMEGVVLVKENMDASGGLFYSGMMLPTYREGDMVSSGRLIAEVVATGALEVSAKVSELDRATIRAGQAVQVKVDGLPGEPFEGKVKTLGGLAGRRFLFDTDSSGQFDVTFQLERRDPRLRPGRSVRIVIAGEQLKDVLYLPRQAVFEKDGKPTVYVRRGDRFEAFEPKLRYRTVSQVVVENLAAGTEVALMNPETKPAAQQPGPTSGGPTVRGAGQ